MSFASKWAAAVLVLASMFPWSTIYATSDIEDDGDIEWAYGTVVDSITVSGNRNTKSYVVLREMETQPGDVLTQETIERDVRFITDLSPFASVSVRADSLAPGRTALRITVTERSMLLTNSILPLFKYDFDTGLTYGLRWKAKNFRGRLEQLNLQATRNELDDEEISLSWSAPWIGWNHIAVGGGVSYFDRGRTPRNTSVLERFSVTGFLALPLTESRIRFAQLWGSLSVDKTRTGPVLETTNNGSEELVTEKELIISPLIGYRFDSRDSGIRPTRGQVLSASVRASYPLDQGAPYYLFSEDARWFFKVSRKSVIAALSVFQYQFGDFPNYSTLSVGGPRSLRGHPNSRFTGFHRWFQTVEWRYLYLPPKVFRLPVVKNVDLGLGFVVFADSGIAWEGSDDFDLDRFHGTGGLGVRLYSPIRDVARFDFGASLQGDARFEVSTGIRF
jgi:outer membrane protein insertion porin family